MFLSAANNKINILVLALAWAATLVGAAGPFLETLSASSWVIGNDLWNITIGPYYGTKLFYKDHDCIGDAVGHYVDYNSGGATVLRWVSATEYQQTDEYLDVAFTAANDVGVFHWVIYSNLTGAYQYFEVNSLPVIGIFRTLFRLDNSTFTYGHTGVKDELLPTYSEILGGTKVQDETWELSDGTYITKYDWVNFVRSQRFYGVYGSEFGSWYIHASHDYFNGNYLKQELMVHRESSTGDVVQLNVLHGTHFQASSSDVVPAGKIWGPWLWYLNGGSATDASSRAEKEAASWPYSFVNDTAYQSRGSVSGQIVLSDGRPAAGAAVFLGDNNPNETTLDQGRYYYYSTNASSDGSFVFENVRSGTYNLQAWPTGGNISDVSTVFSQNDVVVEKGTGTDLSTLTWAVQNRTVIFQVGDLDRQAVGFKYGNAPRQHALVAECPANLTFTVGVSDLDDWCFGQSELGTWSLKFKISSLPSSSSDDSDAEAILSLSLAGYSKGVSESIYLNNVSTPIANLSSSHIASDPSLYRSATDAGEWHLYEFSIEKGLLKVGWNVLSFVVTSSTTWHGIMWDSILLEWAKWGGA